MKKRLIALILGATMLTSLTCTSFAGNKDTYKTPEEIVDFLTPLDKEAYETALLDACSVVDSGDWDALIPYAMVGCDKKDLFSNDELITGVENTSLPLSMRKIYLEIFK